MLDTLNIQYPSYYLIGCVVLGLLYSLALYFRHKNWKENQNYLPIVLGILRGICVAAIAYFLLLPILERFKSRTQDAIVVVAKDTSTSIREGMSEQEYADYLTAMVDLETALSDQFEVETFNFSGQVSVSDASDTLGNLSTDIAKALEYIENQYSDQHIGAIVLASDGIYNEGRNPLYVAKGLTAPLYTVALGDTTIRKDILIKNLLYNKIGYLGDKHEIQVDIQATNVAGAKSTVTLNRIQDGKKSKVDSKVVTVNSNDYFQTVSFTTENSAAGNIQYQVTVSGVSNEISSVNNRKNAYIDIIDARQEIFIVAHAPHPDIHALKQALQSNKNYKISTYIGDDNVPSSKADIVVLHNVPSQKYPHTELMSTINRKKTPRVYITGAQADLKKLLTANIGLKINGVIGQTNEAQAKVTSKFDKFVLENKMRKTIESYPPLLTPFGDYTLTSTAEVLASQRISGIETDYPLIAFDQSQGIRKVFITGEGIWKWRLFNFLQEKNHAVFDELIKKTFQFVGVKDDKRKFRVNIAKENFKVGESIFFDAQLYNDVYELINGPEASLTVKSSDGEKYDYTFSRGNNYYTLDAGSLAEGSYSYTGTVTSQGKALTSSGKFRVEAIQKESYNLTADHGLLHQLSTKHKGKLYMPTELKAAVDEINKSTMMKPMVFQEKENKPLMHYPWLLLPIILLLCIEWFVRRYSGGY